MVRRAQWARVHPNPEPLAEPLDLPPLFPKAPERSCVHRIPGECLPRSESMTILLHAIFLRFPDYHFIFVGST